MASDLRRRTVLSLAFFIALLAFSRGSHPSHESRPAVLAALSSAAFIWHLPRVRHAAAALAPATTDVLITGLCIGPVLFVAYFVAVFQTN